MDDAIVRLNQGFAGLLTALQQIVAADTPGATYWQTYCDTTPSETMTNRWDWLPLLHPDERMATTQALAKALTEHAAYDCEFRLKHANGNYRFFVARAKVEDYHGAYRWLGYCSDITDRKAMENALRENVARTTALLNTAFDSIITLDSMGHIAEMNHAAEGMFGYTRAQCVGKLMPSLMLAPLARETHQAGLKHFLFPVTGMAAPRRLEMMGRRADGASFPIDIALTSTDFHGEIWHTAYIRDITAAKESERALIASERRFRLIFEYVAVGIVQTDLIGNYQRVNRAFCEMLGYHADELIGRTFQDVTHQSDREIGRDDLLAMMRGEQRTCTTEKRYIHKNGAIIWTRLTMSMVYGTENGPDSCLAVIEDITQQKLLQIAHEQLRARNQFAREQADAMAARYSALQSIADTALAHLSLKDLLPEMLDRICAILMVDNITILLLTEDKQFLTIYATRGVEEINAPPLRMPFGMGVAGNITVRCEPMGIDDLHQVEVVNPILQEKLTSLMGVPLLVEGRVIGFIHISTAEQRHFSEEEVRLLQLVADRIALAIDHEQIYAAEQRAHAEAAAHASEFEAIFETIADGVTVYDRDGKVRRMNSAAQRLLGITFLEEEHRKFLTEQHALNYSGEREWGLLSQEDSPPSSSSYVMDAYMHLPDIALVNHKGEHLRIAISGNPMRDDADEITGSVLIWRDVTAQQLIAQRTQGTLNALLEMASLLVSDEVLTLATPENISPFLVKQLALLASTILGCDLLALVALSPEGNILAPITTVGLTQIEEVEWQVACQGKPLRSFLEPEVCAQMLSGESAVVRFAGNHEHSLKSRLTTTLLVPLYIDERCMGILLVDFQQMEHHYTAQEIALANTITRLLALATEHERLVHEREHVLAALQQLNEELIRQNDRLQEVSQLKSKFLANMSHELRTPLNGIIGFTQMLHEEFIGTVSHEQKDVLQDILASAKHLLHLINAVLDLAKVEAGKLEFEVVAVDLAAVVQEVMGTLQPLFLQKRLDFAVTIDAMVTDLLLDPAKLKQVLYNYLSNAIKFTREAGSISMTITPEADACFRVAVTDTGIGIRSEDISSLFVEFQQLDSGHAKKYQGTGLGLALTKRIIEAQGGKVGVESTFGKGSCFWFVLPCQITAQRVLHDTYDLQEIER